MECSGQVPAEPPSSESETTSTFTECFPRLAEIMAQMLLEISDVCAWTGLVSPAQCQEYHSIYDYDDYDRGTARNLRRMIQGGSRL